MLKEDVPETRILKSGIGTSSFIYTDPAIRRTGPMFVWGRTYAALGPVLFSANYIRIKDKFLRRNPDNENPEQANLSDSNLRSGDLLCRQRIYRNWP